MAEEHPGKPNVICQMNIFLKKPLTEEQAREIATFLRGYGVLAVDMRDIHPDSPKFWEAVNEAGQAYARGIGERFGERH
jgi:hypothetical protein